MMVILPDSGLMEIGNAQCTIMDLLARFNINPLEVIVSVNGRVVPEDSVIRGDDRIRIIRIAHGG